jgi:pyruvate/2-oxoglutarate dehydrogenase complex dihydrolipoamide dehydrogenase (E3) component
MPNEMASTTKESWPELVGKTEKEAQEAISKERPELDICVMPESSMPHAIVTMDHRIGRVRIFVDDDRKVTETPNCG